jgi:hypothetical protein
VLEQELAWEPVLVLELALRLELESPSQVPSSS